MIKADANLTLQVQLLAFRQNFPTTYIDVPLFIDSRIPATWSRRPDSTILLGSGNPPVKEIDDKYPV